MSKLLKNKLYVAILPHSNESHSIPDRCENQYATDEAVSIFSILYSYFLRSRPETTTNIETSTRPRPRPRPRQLGIGTETETSKTGFETGLEKYNTEH